MLETLEERINGFIERNGFVTYRQVLETLGLETKSLDDTADYVYWDRDGIHYGDPLIRYKQGVYPILDFNIDDISYL
jgi:hypothetical protein